MRQVPCFTALEPPTLSIDALFPLTHRYFVGLHGYLPITIMPRFSHDTPKSVLQCIYPMQQYIVVETTEVVRFAPFCPSLLAVRLLTPDSMLFQGVAAIRNLMQQRSSLFKQLEVAESMRAFFT